MNAPEAMQPQIGAVTVSRCDRGFRIEWQRGGRPTRRAFGDLGSALHFAHQAASLNNLAIVDLTGGRSEMAKRPSYTSPMPMRLAVDTRHSATALRLIMAVAWHDRMPLMTGAGAGCTASNKTLAEEIGCDYTTLIKLRKHCVETGYFLLEARQGGKRLEVIRIIPDHMADPKSWPFDQSFIGKGCLKAWHSRERKAGETAKNPEPNAGEADNIEGEKVGEPNFGTRGNLPKTDAQYTSLREERYSAKAGEKYTLERARLDEGTDDEDSKNANQEGQEAPSPTVD
jgi:hypothetical protein